MVSVLQNRVGNSAFNLLNGQANTIDNQAKYAGNPASTNYNYANLGNLTAQKWNLPLTSSDCQSFLADISTAESTIQQVLTQGSANTSVYYWYAAGATPWSGAGSVITTINNTSFYGQ